LDENRPKTELAAEGFWRNQTQFRTDDTRIWLGRKRFQSK